MKRRRKRRRCTKATRGGKGEGKAALKDDGRKMMRKGVPVKAHSFPLLIQPAIHPSIHWAFHCELMMTGRDGYCSMFLLATTAAAEVREEDGKRWWEDGGNIGQILEQANEDKAENSATHRPWLVGRMNQSVNRHRFFRQQFLFPSC